jgi:type I restriction enzyme S subunit
LNSRLIFGDCAELRSEKVDPRSAKDSYYIGLEHIEQQSLRLTGHGFGKDVDSQKQKFYKGDILFGKLRPYFRKVVIAPFDGICSTDIWVVTPKSGIDRNFLFYWMASADFISSSTYAAEGGRMPRAQWDWVSKFELEFRTLKEQRAIGKILETLDAKIAVNFSISKTLQDIAQLLFTSWFIDFDPVKAKMDDEKPIGIDDQTAALFPNSFEESEFGFIPKGWELTKLGEVISKLESGKRPRGGAQTEGIPSVGAESIRGLGKFNFSSTKFVSEEFYRKMSTGKVSSYDVLIYKDGAGAGSYVSMFGEGFPFEEFAINEHVFLLRANKVPQIYLYLWLNQDSQKHLMVELSQKSAQPGLNQQDTKSIPILLPPTPLLKAFNEIVEPFIKSVLKYSHQNTILENCRDGLLPKLIAGELQIPEEMLAS